MHDESCRSGSQVTSMPVLEPAPLQQFERHRAPSLTEDSAEVEAPRRVSFLEGLQSRQDIHQFRADSPGYRPLGHSPSESARRRSGVMRQPSLRQTLSLNQRQSMITDRLTQARRQSCATDLLGYKQLPTFSDVEDLDPELGSSADPSSWNLDLRSTITSYLQAVIDSTAFQIVTMGCIIINAAIIGFETDYPEMKVWETVENFFLFVFTLELLLRIITQGPAKFFCGSEPHEDMPRHHRGKSFKATLEATAAKESSKAESTGNRRKAISGDAEMLLTLAWNLFDFLIVGIGLLNTTASLFGVSEYGGGAVTIFRAMRLLRVLRVLRVIRVLRFFKQLYLLAYGFMEGTMAVFWVAVLTSCCIYLFSIVLVKSYGHPDEKDPNKEFFIIHFGSVSRAMFTLFEVLASPTLGNYREVILHHPPLTLFLLFFVIFGSFGVSGLLTGVITESIIDKNQARIEEQRHERETKRHILEEQSILLFEEMVEERDDEMTDESGEPCLNIEDLANFKEHINLLFQASGVALPTYDFDQMCEAMDFNDSGSINKGEFVHGILELCEDVRPMSIMELNSQVSKMKLKIGVIQTDVEEMRIVVDPRFQGRRGEEADDDRKSVMTSSCSRKASDDAELTQMIQTFVDDAEVRRQVEHNELKQMIQTLMKDDFRFAEETNLGPTSTPMAAAVDVIDEGAQRAPEGHQGVSSHQTSRSSAEHADQQQCAGSVFAPGAATGDGSN